MQAFKQRQIESEAVPPRWNIGIDRNRVIAYVGVALVAGFALGFVFARSITRGERPAELPLSKSEAATNPKPEVGQTQDFHRVTRIRRADLVDIEGVGPVRMLGIETPDGKTPREIYGVHGKNALAFTQKSLAGQEVRIELDPTASPRGSRDDSGNTVAYIYTRDGILFNEELVRQGHAFVRVEEPFRQIEEFRILEREAMKAMRGVWGLSDSTAAASNLASADQSTADSTKPAAKDEKSKKVSPLLPSEIGPNVPAISGPTSQASTGPAVFVSSGDRLYHKAGCEYLDKKRQAIALPQAKSSGYTACGRCFASTVLKAP